MLQDEPLTTKPQYGPTTLQFHELIVQDHNDVVQEISIFYLYDVVGLAMSLTTMMSVDVRRRCINDVVDHHSVATTSLLVTLSTSQAGLN
ncbi:unnamed protein product [Linum trigynum]|uniref:Uncharacterized protein n=1 Tax=Linum trigynum TaxID=586398 RepID=A0AAV2DZ40_9ROSI